MSVLRIYCCGFYQGRGRGSEPRGQTALLLASKYHSDLLARGRMITEMVKAVRAHRLVPSIVTYAPGKDSGFQHARALAWGIADTLDLELLAPAHYRTRDLTRARLLLIDDVFKTGRTMTELKLRLLANLPGHMDGLVYLVTRDGAGTPIA